MKTSQHLATKKEFAASAYETFVFEIVALVIRTNPPDVVATKLEELGATIGRRLAERLTKDKGRFASDLEAVRFLCKEFWQELNGKTADGLKTDKKGTFQVEDKSFRYLTRVSAAEHVNLKDEALKFVLLPCGIIKGALDALGYDAQVKCQILQLPSTRFIITLTSQQK